MKSAPLRTIVPPTIADVGVKLVIEKVVAVTVTMTDGYINLTFDDAMINGYDLLVNERASEVKKISKDLSSEERKSMVNAVYVEYYKELERKKLKNQNVDQGQYRNNGIY